MSGQPALYVATNLATWEPDDSATAPPEVTIGGIRYQRLDPAYYAWLRRCMERAKVVHDSGKLGAPEFDTLRSRFNAIHDRAVAQFGQPALAEAIRTAAKVKPSGVAAPSPTNAAPPATAPTVPSPPPPPPPAAAAPFRFPATGEFRFTERVSPEAVAMVDAIRDQAVSLGWTLPQLYRNRASLKYPCGPDWGLVTFLDDGQRIGEVTREFIEIIHPGPRESRGRFHNMEVDQPWLKRIKPKPAL